MCVCEHSGFFLAFIPCDAAAGERWISAYTHELKQDLVNVCVLKCVCGTTNAVDDNNDDDGVASIARSARVRCRLPDLKRRGKRKCVYLFDAYNTKSDSILCASRAVQVYQMWTAWFFGMSACCINYNIVNQLIRRLKIVVTE